MKQAEDLKKFLKNRPHLCWWVKDIEKLSERTAVEATLNHGDWPEVQGLMKILRPRKLAAIFFKESSKKRHNYHKRTKYFFSLYLKKYAS